MWERYAEGRTLVGVNEADADFAAGKTGGEKAHLLTAAESGQKAVNTGNQSANHTHYQYVNLDSTSELGGSNPSGRGAVYREAVSGGSNYNMVTTANNQSHYHSIGASNAASAHNNMPPYIATYFWKRTA